MIQRRRTGRRSLWPACVPLDEEETAAGLPVVGEEPYGPVVTAAVAPPPISGGTLLALTDWNHAVASDPDRDQVYFVDWVFAKLESRIKLMAGDQPGRLVEDGNGRVHVVLRGGGAVATIDRHSASIVDRRPVCPTPRGIALDAGGDLLVACMNGDVMRLGAGGGPARLAAHLDADLRDLVARPGGFYATRFRAAEVLVLDENLALVNRFAPPDFQMQDVRNNAPFTPRVAWRAAAIPGTDDMVVVHQRAQVSRVAPVAVSGYYTPTFSPASAVVVMSGPVPDTSVVRAGLPVTLPLQAIAVAYTRGGTLLVQSREPAVIITVGTGGPAIKLSEESRFDTGHLIFHSSAGDGADIACASCHAEGGDDGHVWNFAEGERRTPPLRGGIARRAPYHWDGAETTLGKLAEDVFNGRMNGPTLGDGELGALAGWLETIDALPPQRVIDPGAVERGKVVFQQGDCASCHTDGKPVFANVHTGGEFKAPPLRSVAWRLSVMHDGCATTLAGRFTICGGGDGHGRTMDMSPAQRADLIAYLESL